jgi:hypothetical protein
LQALHHNFNLNKDTMQEFMLFVRTEGDPWAKMSTEDMQSHVKKGMEYIGGLMKSGKLKSAHLLPWKVKPSQEKKVF